MSGPFYHTWSQLSENLVHFRTPNLATLALCDDEEMRNDHAEIVECRMSMNNYE
jgi:hypothetical protein